MNPFIIRVGENLDCDECKTSFFPNAYQRLAKEIVYFQKGNERGMCSVRESAHSIGGKNV